MTGARAATYLFCGLTVAAVGQGLLALSVAPAAGDAALLAVATLVALCPLAAGLLVNRHAPRSVVGPILASSAPVLVGAAGGQLYDRAAVDGELPTSTAWAALSQGSWMLLFLPAAFLLLYFPNGRLPGPRWRVVPAAFVVVLVIFQIGAAFTTEPYAEPYEDMSHPSSPLLAALAVAVLPVFLGLLVASVVSLFVRYRRATPTEQHQLRWLQLAAVSLPVTLLLCWTSYLLFDGPDLVLLGLVFVYVSFPAATAIAVIRHDLYDVDRAIVLATAYTALGAVLLLVFTAASATAGLLVGGDSTVIAVVATALCALALGPARDRLSARVARSLYPGRQRALDAIEDLRRRVHAGAAVPEQLDSVLRLALDDPSVRVGYPAPGRATYVDRDGRVVSLSEHCYPVTLAGQRVGVIAAGADSQAWLLRDVADEAALLVEMARLRLELAQAVQDVEASRSRLLLAGYEERRRLEMDLHDGAQQRLVSLGMSLRLAQRHLGDGTVDMDTVIDGAVAEIGTAVSELRQIAHGLRPSSLDDGLAAALSNLTRSVPIRVELEVPADEPPDHISTTAYYVASEALANAIKHADAGSVALCVRQDGARLRVTVRDDGRGGALIEPGSGLAGLRDRVQALGGTLGVTSGPGAGTVVEAVLPCAS
jgi:signal transduction histidine kinase